MPSPTISVIVPVYNMEKTLHRCIDSILAQTFTDFELLLINDGSKDKSGIICDSYALLDSRVRVFHKSNGGVSSARNLGLDKARGEWVTFCDSDDLVTERFLEMLYCENGDFDLIGVSRAVNEIEERLLPDIKCHNHYEVITALKNIYDYNFREVTGRLFRMDIISKYNLKFKLNVNWGEDTLFMLDFLNYCNTMKFQSEILYLYTIMDNSLTQKRSAEDEFKFIECLWSSVMTFNNIDNITKIVIFGKFGYYHLENILRELIIKAPTWAKKKENLSYIGNNSLIKVLIKYNHELKGKRSRIFDALLRNNLISICLLYMRFLIIIGKPNC